MSRIAAIDGGTSYHHEALHTERFGGYFDDIIYVLDLHAARLADFDAIVVTCRTNPALLAPYAARFRRYLSDGGMIVAMGETFPEHWLPGIRWRPRPTNYWWWLDPNARSGLTVAAPDHNLFRFLTLADATWHFHGLFTPPDGAVSVIDHEDGGSILYDDRVSTAGRMVVTALDPFYHHGSHFMPNATRFLDGFLPWLRAEVARR